MLYAIGRLLAVIGIGILWRFTSPRQITAGALQRTLTVLLYMVFIPALVLLMMWNMTTNANTLRIVGVVLGTTGIALLAAWLLIRNKRWSPGVKGSLILAAAFGNVLILGMPLTTTAVAAWTQRTAAQFEALAIIPLLLTVGVMMARKYGQTPHGEQAWMPMAKEPIVWATVIGIALNLLDVKMPALIGEFLKFLISALVPLMLITVGLAIQWRAPWPRLMPMILPVAAIQLILTPLVLWGLTHAIGLTGTQTFKSLILQAAMPSMLLGFIICDRYRLDMGVYTVAFSATTVLSLITVPLWFWALSSGLIS